MALEIHKATMADLGDVLVLSNMMHDESPRFSRHKFAVDKATQLVEFLMEHGCLLLAKDRGQTIGFVAGVVSKHFLSHSTYATDIGVFVTPEHRGGSTFYRLVKAFEQWAEDMGVDEICLGVSTDVQREQTVRMYERLGYTMNSIGLVKVRA